MNDLLNKAKQITKEYHQEHVFRFYETLNNEKKEKLISQILSIDFKTLTDLYEKTKIKEEKKEDKIEPISYVDKEKITAQEKEMLEKVGIEEIKAGKLAVVTMAGGQGTRLGHHGPKGTFILDTENQKSLFEILCDTLKKAKEDYGAVIPWYIMTSKENYADTVAFFEKENYFHYGRENIFFFKQGEFPMLDTNGKLLLNEEGTIKEAADGHGGVFESIIKNGVLQNMQQRKIEWIFIGGVDNCLVKMVDPLFIGMAVQKKVLAAGKSLVKASPEEKVGVFCKKNGKPSVIEYTEITKEMAEMKNKDGELVYGESHILCNMFHIKAIEQIGDHKLPYHIAFKKATYKDENGNMVEPTEPNAYKFESFLFDAFERLDDMLILRVKREEEFAPVKNASGVDSPETARKLYHAFHKKSKNE